MMLNNLPWTTEIPCQTNYDNEYIYPYLLFSKLTSIWHCFNDCKFLPNKPTYNRACAVDDFGGKQETSKHP